MFLELVSTETDEVVAAPRVPICPEYPVPKGFLCQRVLPDEARSEEPVDKNRRLAVDWTL